MRTIKFKRRDTGEIVNIVSWGATGSYTDYYDSKGEFHHTDLNRYNHFEEIIEDTKDGIDWEQRRYEIAKEAVNGLLAAPVVEDIDPNPPMDGLFLIYVVIGVNGNFIGQMVIIGIYKIQKVILLLRQYKRLMTIV